MIWIFWIFTEQLFCESLVNASVCLLYHYLLSRVCLCLCLSVCVAKAAVQRLYSCFQTFPSSHKKHQWQRLFFGSCGIILKLGLTTMLFGVVVGNIQSNYFNKTLIMFFLLFYVIKLTTNDSLFLILSCLTSSCFSKDSWECFLNIISLSISLVVWIICFFKEFWLFILQYECWIVRQTLNVLVWLKP